MNCIERGDVMKVDVMTLQIDGIDIASLKEEEILALIKKDVEEQGNLEQCVESISVYINMEGTAVTAYYTCENCSGAVRLNP